MTHFTDALTSASASIGTPWDQIPGWSAGLVDSGNTTVRGWSAIASNGQFLIVANTGNFHNAGGYAYANGQDTGNFLHYLQVKYRGTSWNGTTVDSSGVSHCVAILFKDAANYLGWRVYAGELYLTKMIGGVFSNFQDCGVTVAAGDVIRAEIKTGGVLEIKKNGTVVSGAAYTLNSGEQSTFAGIGKVYVVTDESGILISDWDSDATVVSNSLTITKGPKANQVLQRVKGQTYATYVYELSFTGSAPDDIQAQIEDASGNVLSAYATVSGATIGSSTITTVSVNEAQDSAASPAGRVVKFRSRVAGVVRSGETPPSSNTHTVGAIIIPTGQSLQVGIFNSGGSIAYAGRNANYDYLSDTWSQPTTQVAGGELANRLATQLGVPVGLAFCAVGGKDIRFFTPAYTDPTDGAITAGNGWAGDDATSVPGIARVIARVGDAEGALWNQGQTIMSGYTQTKHTLALTTIIAGMLSLTGRSSAQFFFRAVRIGRDTSGSMTDSYIASVNKAIAAATGVTIAAETYDLALRTSSDVHLSDAGYLEEARREAYGALGPSITTAVYTGSGPYTTTVSFSGSLGGNSASLTGYVLLDSGGSAVTITGASRSGDQVTLTSTGNVPANLTYAYGATPNVTTVTQGAVTPPGSSTPLPVQATQDPIPVHLGRIMPAATGTFALTGNTARLLRTRLMAATAGAFVLNGVAASLKRNRLVAAATGTFALVGNAATLTKTSAKTLVAAAGAFTMSGVDAALRVGRRLTAATGAFALTGHAAALTSSGGGTVSETLAVTLDDLKVKTNIVAGDGDAYDAQLTQCLKAAIEEVETLTSTKLLQQPYVLELEAWPAGSWHSGVYTQGQIDLRVGPVVSVDGITYTAADGSEATLDASVYVVRTRYGRTCIRRATNQSWPPLGDDPLIRVTATVGFAAAPGLDVPAWAVDAVLVGAQGRFDGTDYMPTVQAIVSPHRLVLV